MIFATYIHALENILQRIRETQAAAIEQAGKMAAGAIAAGGVLHVFGTGHSHLIAEEAFYRAGGLAGVNPILDERLIFLRGALESTRAERDEGLAARLLTNIEVRDGDAAVLISNSGCNAVPVEMAVEMKARGAQVIVITSLEHSRAAAARHSSGKRLFELADVVIDNGVPTGDALLDVPGLQSKIGPASTVAGAAIMNSVIVEAAAELARQGVPVPVFPSANLPGVSDRTLAEIMRPYSGRIRYLDA